MQRSGVSWRQLAAAYGSTPEALRVIISRARHGHDDRTQCYRKKRKRDDPMYLSGIERAEKLLGDRVRIEHRRDGNVILYLDGRMCDSFAIMRAAGLLHRN